MATKEKKEKRKGYFLRHINRKHRVSFRSVENDEEVGFLYISTLRITLLTLATIVVIIVAVVLTIIYTPLLDKLPVYSGRDARDKLISNVYRIDSLESQLSLLQAYSDNVALIMDGKAPLVRHIRGEADSLSGSGREQVARTEADSLFRRDMERGERYGLVKDATPMTGVARQMNFQPPVTAGRITAPFDLRSGHLGIGIIFSEPQQVVAIADGTVTMSLWTPEEEYIIAIQHKDNFLSIYRHASQLLAATGERVGAGKVIAYATPASGGGGAFTFELWYNGQPIDPERYITSLSNIR